MKKKIKKIKQPDNTEVVMRALTQTLGPIVNGLSALYFVAHNDPNNTLNILPVGTAVLVKEAVEEKNGYSKATCGIVYSAGEGYCQLVVGPRVGIQIPIANVEPALAEDAEKALADLSPKRVTSLMRNIATVANSAFPVNTYNYETGKVIKS